jgi:hypothetical protein
MIFNYEILSICEIDDKEIRIKCMEKFIDDRIKTLYVARRVDQAVYHKNEEMIDYHQRNHVKEMIFEHLFKDVIVERKLIDMATPTITYHYSMTVFVPPKCDENPTI